MLYQLLITAQSTTSAWQTQIRPSDRAAREARKRYFHVLQWEVGSASQDYFRCLDALELTQCPEALQRTVGLQHC